MQPDTRGDLVMAPRRRPVFEAVSGTIGIAVAAVVGYAVWRQFTSPGEPVLPMAWCRANTPVSLPPIQSSAAFTQWTADWIALVALAVVTALYLSGLRLVHRSGGHWSRWRTASFLVGILVVVLATCSSVAVYDMVLFSTHMIGHLMLVMVAPFFLAAGRPLTLAIAACGEPWRSRLERAAVGRVVAVVTSPPVALALYTAAIVGTHLTGLMNTIMTRPWAGQAEHLLYLVVGYIFFTVVLGEEPIRWRLTTQTRWLLLGVAMAVDTFVGVILIMTTKPIQLLPVPGYDVNPLGETAAGGAIMWVGGDGIMVVVMILIALQMVADPARRRADRQGWTERVRQNVFAEHVSGAAASAVDEVDPDFDDNDTRLAEYNRWLANLNKD